MTFEGQYLTYADYTALVRDLGGSAMAEMPFNVLEFEARRKIDIRTFNRLKNSSNIPQEVKLCEYDMINSINGYIETENEIVNNGNVESENTDGYSIKYITSDKIKDIVKSKNKELDDIIMTYLLGVIYNGEHLVYCGTK